MRAYRLAWEVGTGVLVAIGLELAVSLMGLGQTLALSLPLAGIAGLYAYLYAPSAEAAPRYVAVWCVRVACGAPVVVGLLAATGGGGLLLVLVCVLTNPDLAALFTRWYAARRQTAWQPASVTERISDRDLVLAWQSSYEALQTNRDVRTLARIVRVRGMLLDELERRAAPRSRRWTATPEQIVSDRRHPPRVSP